MLWTANSGSDAICDWSWDGGVHFIRSLHMLVDKQDDSTVNGINTIFWQLVSGTAPTISITARQVVGITGLSIVGVNNPTWPALGSQVAIIDGGAARWRSGPEVFGKGPGHRRPPLLQLGSDGPGTTARLEAELLQRGDPWRSCQGWRVRVHHPCPRLQREGDRAESKATDRDWARLNRLFGRLA